RPYVVVIGGAKVSDKIGVLRNLLEHADCVLIGGAMCFTFLKAMGGKIGASLLDAEHLADVHELLTKGRILLPTDVVCAASVDASDGSVVDGMSIPDGLMGLDIGPETAKGFAQKIAEA